jgi:hypothetical protein
MPIEPPFQPHIPYQRVLLGTRSRKLPESDQESNGIELRVCSLDLEAPLILGEEQEVEAANGKRRQAGDLPAKGDGVA